MLTAILTLLVAGSLALGYARRLGHNRGPIAHRPYNNRYNDASGAREDGFL
jgi:hypothetical protein